MCSSIGSWQCRRGRPATVRLRRLWHCRSQLHKLLLLLLLVWLLLLLMVRQRRLHGGLAPRLQGVRLLVLCGHAICPGLLLLLSLLLLLQWWQLVVSLAVLL